MNSRGGEEGKTEGVALVALSIVEVMEAGPWLEVELKLSSSLELLMHRVVLISE